MNERYEILFKSKRSRAFSVHGSTTYIKLVFELRKGNVFFKGLGATLTADASSLCCRVGQTTKFTAN